MDKPYFVMVYDQDGESAQPLVDDNGAMRFWDSMTEACIAGHEHFYASRFGFEVHEMGHTHD